jgi:hypothetical protein
VGGAAFLAILLYCIATTCCAGARSDGASDKDSRVAASSSGYQSAGGAYASVGPPPTRVSTGRDEVSAMDYPKDGLESMGDYQDQRCACFSCYFVSESAAHKLPNNTLAHIFSRDGFFGMFPFLGCASASFL